MPLEDELKEFAKEAAQEVAKNIPTVEFPYIQKVEVTNFPEYPEQKDPVINVTVPEVKVPEPKVTVNVAAPEIPTPIVNVEAADLSSIAQGFKDLGAKIDALLAKEVPQFDYKEFERIAKANKSEYRGGGIGPSKTYHMDKAGKAINPAEMGSVSDGNSSTTALNDSTSFTGVWEDVSKYESVTVAIATDKSGYYDTQFSPDGTNVDSSLRRYHKDNEIHVPHRFTVTRKYFRVVFTNNSGENQTYFRLQSMFGNKQPLNIPIDGTMAQDFDATVTRPTEFRYESALGLRQGVTTWNKFAFNTDIDSGTELVAAQGGSITILTTASTLTIVSSSTDDDGSPVGTGARTIVIYGIDANRRSQTEVVTMDGTTPVITSTTWLGINRVAVASAGSTQSNVGNITVTATTGGSTQAYVPAGLGVTEQMIFFTQSDHRSLVDWVLMNAQREGPATPPIVTFKWWIYSPVSNAKYEVFRQIINTNVDDHTELVLSQPFVFNSGDVFWIEATTDQNNTSVAARISLIEFKDVDA